MGTAAVVEVLDMDGLETKVGVRFLSRRAALSSGRAQGSNLTLFLPGELAVAAAAPVRLLVTFGDSPRSFELKGRIESSVGQAMGAASVGCTVAFDGDAKRQVAEMLAFCADRPPRMGTAMCQRFEVKVPCRVKRSEGTVSGQVLDLSRTGAFVAARERVRPGESVEVQLAPGLLGLGGTRLQARVVWKGEKEGRSGFAVRFSDGAACDAKVVSKYRIKGRGRP